MKEPAGCPPKTIYLKGRDARKPKLSQTTPTVVSERPNILTPGTLSAQSRRGRANQPSGAQPKRKQNPKLNNRGAQIQATGQANSTTSHKFSAKLVGPSPVESIREGIYTKALLECVAQVTLLYRDLYNKHLKHLPLQKLDELKIWGIGTQTFPYNSYLPVELTFDPYVAGKTDV